VPFVLDASTTAVWAFDDEDHPGAAAALQATLDDVAIVPSLWWFELRSTLVTNERRKRSTPERSAEFLTYLGGLSIEIEALPAEDEVFALARRHGLTFYDASYLEIAVRQGLPLATLDRALRKAAEAEGVALVGA
jgi:predicted nucleic acid-binding protein